MLTQIGNTFAGRVAASLLTALDLPELIVATEADHKHLAVVFANNLGWLEATKTKLANNRAISPLFNSEIITQHLEAAYKAMNGAKTSPLQR